MNNRINISILQTVFHHLDLRGVNYLLGAKAEKLQADTSKIRYLDCSGFSQYGIAKATDQQVIIPAGSWNQNDYFTNANYREVNYNDLPQADWSRLFIAFIRAGHNGAGSYGHVWFVTKFLQDSPPVTMECYGGHGVGSRSWDYPTLRREVFQCFEIPTL